VNCKFNLVLDIIVEWQGFPWKCEQPLCTVCEVPCVDCQEAKINHWRRQL